MRARRFTSMSWASHPLDSGVARDRGVRRAGLALCFAAMMVLVYAFGAGLLAFGAFCVALAVTLDPVDRRKALNVVRHPIASIFGADAPEHEGESTPGGLQ